MDNEDANLLGKMINNIVAAWASEEVDEINSVCKKSISIGQRIAKLKCPEAREINERHRLIETQLLQLQDKLRQKILASDYARYGRP